MLRYSNLAVALVLIAVIPVAAVAQSEIDPVGWWRATTETPDGELSTTLRLDYFDGELSGTFRNSFISAQLPIFDAFIEGAHVEI